MEKTFLNAIRNFLLMATLIFVGTAASAQITGKVTDTTTGEALIGASVLVKGTTTGTTTGIDGSFSLNLPENQNILLISYTGYSELEVDMTGLSNYTATMLEASELIDEVVVIGYGRQKKSVVTGAVGSVDIVQLENRSPGRL